jgi:hypothetical protein
MQQTMTRNDVASVATPTTVTFRTSVGDFIFRRAEFDWRLEIRSGKIRRILGIYETDDAAILALRNRHTGFRPWDMMGRNAAAIQVDTPQRWGRNGGSH